MMYLLCLKKRGKNYFVKEVVSSWPIVVANVIYTDVYFRGLTFASRDDIKKYIQEKGLEELDLQVEVYAKMKKLDEDSSGKVDRRKLRVV